MYIVFEGIVGTGKTSQSKKLYNYLKHLYPSKEILWTREPGGSEIADKIREVVQGTKFSEDMDPICEAYLYAASRAQALRLVIKPVLDKNGTVISDRSYLTSLTNQAFCSELGYNLVWEINKYAVDNITPDYIFFLDLDFRVAIQRTFDGSGDKFEKYGVDFYKRAYEGYQKLKKLPEFKDKWFDIDANGSEEEVFNRIKLAIQPLL